MAITSPTDFIEVVSTGSPLASAERGEWKGNAGHGGIARPQGRPGRVRRPTVVCGRPGTPMAGLAGRGGEETPPLPLECAV